MQKRKQKIEREKGTKEGPLKVWKMHAAASEILLPIL